MKRHLAVTRRFTIGAGEQTTSQCGRRNAAAEGMNVTADEAAVTCRFCLRQMATARRLRAAKARRDAGVAASGGRG